MITSTSQSTIKKNTFISVTLAMFFLLIPSIATAKLLDRVVAVVNDSVITLSELDEFGVEYLDKVRKNTPKESLEQELLKTREKLLDTLVRQHLITQKAADADVVVTDSEFENAYKKNIASLKLSRQELLQKLEESGLTEELYRKNMRSQFLRDKLVLYEVRSKIIVTEKMIEEYYNAEYAEKTGGGGYYLLQMGFTWGSTSGAQQSPELTKADKEQAHKRAEQARQAVLDGANFNFTAKEKSDLPSAADGGDLGLFQEDEMAQYMREAILPLKAGEISPIIETPDSFQFFKLFSSKEGEIIHSVPLFSVEEEIRKKLYEKKFKEEFKEWVEKIKKDSYVKKMLL